MEQKRLAHPTYHNAFFLIWKVSSDSRVIYEMMKKALVKQNNIWNRNEF